MPCQIIQTPSLCMLICICRNTRSVAWILLGVYIVKHERT